MRKPCSCSGEDTIAVRYLICNQSKYSIWLKFDGAEHGDNPDDIYLEPYTDTDKYPVTLVDAYGCSNGLFTGYETKAALLMRVPDSESYVNLAYLHLKIPFLDDSDRSFSSGGSFSFEDQAINPPLCSCTVSTESSWIHMKSIDCSSYNGSVLNSRVEVDIGCN